MKRGILFLTLILIAALFTACGESEALKEIRQARKAGHPARALELAVASLNSDSDQMDVWCQLAYANLDFVRLSRDYDDPFLYVVRSALMCASLETYEGKLPSDWEALKSIVRGQLIARVRAELDRIDDSHRVAQEQFQQRLDEGYFDHYPAEIREKIIDDYQKSLLKNGSDPFVNPVFAREIVWKSACYSILLKFMGDEEREDVRITQDLIDQKLNEWPSYSELDPSFITDTREEAATAVNEAYSALLNDLKTDDYFTVQNVLKMNILP